MLYSLDVTSSWWDDPNEYRIFDDVVVHRATRTPCLVCGHPTGDCTGDSTYPDSIVFHGMPSAPNAYERTVHEQGFLVAEDVWEHRQITPFTVAKVLAAAKGTYISFSRARDLGLIEDETA